MMKLKLKKNEKQVHSEFVTNVCWGPNNQLYSLSDDKSVLIWDINCDYVSKFKDLNEYFTCMRWSPFTKSGSEVLALGGSTGRLEIVEKSGKAVKAIEDAHSSAIICVCWSSDSNAFASSGEDGQVKIWSRQGVLRSTLVQIDMPVFCIAWSPDENYIVYTSDKNLCIKPVLKGGLKTISWKAHDELVLCVDWNPVNKLIVSGGEDRRYKIWDQYGRNLFTSSIYNYVITSIKWAPSGEYFSAGSFNTVRLCNKNGWSYSFNKIESGGILHMDWSSDSTTLACAGGNGSVCYGYVVDRSVTWQNLEVCLDENNKIVVTDYFNETFEEIDFRDRLIDMAVGYNYLIVVTAIQCHIYPIQNLQTPYKFDLKDKVKLILMSPKYFGLIDDSNNLNIYAYDGKQIQSPNIQGVRISGLSRKNISLSNDVLAILSPNAPKSIKLFDIQSGKPLMSTIEHSLEISEISLNQSEGNLDRKVCFIDNNKDLYISNVFNPRLIKIIPMCDSFSWNDSNDMLCALADEKFYAWVYPNSVYIDKELLDGSKYEKDASDAGKNPSIINFSGSFCNILKSDGSLCSKTITPYAGLLLNLLNFSDGIDRALKLCRYVKDKVLWTAFSAICLNYRAIQTAENAVASIDEVDKVDFIEKIMDLRGKVNENLISAYILLLSNKIEEAEAILIQGKLYYRAIKMNINLFRWDRALNLARTYKMHLDTVLAYRKRYLENNGMEETNSKFIELGNEVVVEWEKIKENIRQEKLAEQA